MLEEIGALAYLTRVYQEVPPTLGNFFVGLVSAAVDNVPLTAALIKADPAMSSAQWLSLTYAVGVGGSLLVIGSASGIVCMSKVPGLTVSVYARYLPALLFAYSWGYLVSVVLAQWLF